MSATIEYREYRPEDAASFLCLRNSVFPELSTEFWHSWSQSAVTASVAIAEGQVIGTVPFHFRNFQVRPDAVVPVAWEFSVCVREGLRSSGIGSRLLDTAKEFLRGRCVAMAVYRGDERSDGYRYYSRNGHHDLLYVRPWVRTGRPLTFPEAIETCSWDEFLMKEKRYLDVFASAYSVYGGFPQRNSGYYAPAVATSQNKEVPVELQALSSQDKTGKVNGYAIVGREQLRPALHLMELATRNNDLAVALALMTAFSNTASAYGVPATVSAVDTSPYTAVLRALDFQPSSRAQRSKMIMAHVLDHEMMARKLWRENTTTTGLDVVAWTPEREAFLHRGRKARRRVVLEMKEDSLTRLLFGRLDLKAAYDQGIVTAISADRAEIEAIAKALPPTPWVYHYLDYI